MYNCETWILFCCTAPAAAAALHKTDAAIMQQYMLVEGFYHQAGITLHIKYQDPLLVQASACWMQPCMCRLLCSLFQLLKVIMLLVCKPHASSFINNGHFQSSTLHQMQLDVI